MSHRAYIIVPLILALAVSCGPETKSPLVKLQYDASVTKDQQELLLGDLELLSTIKFDGDSEHADIMDITSFTGENVAAWLQERAKFVVGKDFAPEITAVAADILDPAVSKSRVAMSNLGGGIYLGFRHRKNGVQLTVAGQNVVVKSPRVGIFKVGEGLFDSLTEDPLHRMSSTAHGVKRLSTLFHEARHSDGNGKVAAFAHVECPDGDLAGQLACDKWTNGPYAVDAEMNRRLYKACANGRCSISDRVALLLDIADARSRVRGTQRGDSTPVKEAP